MHIPTPNNIPLYELFLMDKVKHLVSLNSKRSSNTLLVDLYKQFALRLGCTSFFEFGAREADFSYWIATEAPPSDGVHCFEANPYSYAQFRKRFGHIGNCSYINKAISDTNGVVRLYIPVNEGDQDLKKGTSSLGKRTDTDSKYIEVDVESITLDSYIDNRESPTVFAWVDLEGQLGRALDGGAEFFKNLSALFIEVEEVEYWQGQRGYNEIMNYFLDCGLVPIARDREHGAQHNVILVRDTCINKLKPLLLDYYYLLSLIGDTPGACNYIRLPRECRGGELPFPPEASRFVIDTYFARLVRFRISLDCDQDVSINSALMSFVFRSGGHDMNSEEMDLNLIMLNKSPDSVIGLYKYIPTTEGRNTYEITIRPPENVDSIAFFISKWRTKSLISLFGLEYMYV